MGLALLLATATAHALPTFAEVRAAHRPSDAVVVDRDGVVLRRRDGDEALAEILDALDLVPGRRHGERDVGTTAAAVALHEGVAVTVEGPEHLHPAADLRVAALDDDAALAMAVAGVDAVSHQAARVGLGVDFDDLLVSLVRLCIVSARARF